MSIIKLLLDEATLSRMRKTIREEVHIYHCYIKIYILIIFAGFASKLTYLFVLDQRHWKVALVSIVSVKMQLEMCCLCDYERAPRDICDLKRTANIFYFSVGLCTSVQLVFLCVFYRVVFLHPETELKWLLLYLCDRIETNSANRIFWCTYCSLWFSVCCHTVCADGLAEDFDAYTRSLLISVV